jgi:hypothetical protein
MWMKDEYHTNRWPKFYRRFSAEVYGYLSGGHGRTPTHWKGSVRLKIAPESPDEVVASVHFVYQLYHAGTYDAARNCIERAAKAAVAALSGEVK